MPTASAASEIAPTPHPRDELKSLALEADQFFASDDWKNADAPTRQKYLDRTAEVFDEAFTSAESSLDAAEADSFYNSTTAFLQGKMAEHNSRDADEKRRRAAADKSMQVFTERRNVTPEQVSGVVKRSLEVAGGMSAQTRGSGVMKLDGEQGKASIGVQPLDWTPSAEEFWKDHYDLTASEAEKKSAKDFARSKGKDSLADDLLYRSAVAGEESTKLAARDIAFSKGADAAGVAAAEQEATSAYRRNAKLAALESTQSSERNPKGRKLPFRVVRTNGMLNIEPEEGKAEEAMMAAERMGLLTSEEAARLIPSGVEMDKEFASRPKAQGGLVTAVKEFGSAILPALGTAAGTAIGAAASKGDVSTAMVGGASGGSAALWLQNKVFGQVDQAQREANARAHPGWAQVGSFVPFLVSMFQKTPPALTTVGKMAQTAKVSLTPGTAAARWESALQSGVAMGRAGFSSGVQQRYVEGNKDVNPIDEGVRSFIAGGAMGILKPAKSILMAMTGKAVKDAAAVTFAEGLYDLAVHNKPIDFKAIADEAPGTFTAFALQNAVMGVFHKFQHSREMAKMAGKSAAAANTAAAEAAEAQAKRFRKDGFIESAIASEALAETHRRAAKQDEKAATEQYWQDVAKAQKRAVEHTQANEGPLTERAAYGRTGDVYDAFGNVQRKAGGFLGLPDAGNPEGTPKAQATPVYVEAKGDEVQDKSLKGTKYESQQMSPDAYLKETGGYSATTINQKKVDALKEKILAGVPLDPPTLDYNEYGDVSAQEGRHRAEAAKQLGIKRIPVVMRDVAVDANYKPEPAKESEPKNEKAQSVPSVQKADEPVRLPQKEVAPATQTYEPTVTAEHFSDSGKFYRVVVGDEAFTDIVNSGVVRTNAGDKAAGGTLAERMAARPTAFPSFSSGSASMSYAAANPNHYIVVTDDASIQPSKQGRHGKGTTMFPTDAQGNPTRSLSGKKVQVYKHTGDGNYELVYADGRAVTSPAAVAPSQPAAVPSTPSWISSSAQSVADSTSPLVRGQIADLSAQRLTAKEIAGRLGITEDTVRLVRVADGIPPWTNSTNQAGGQIESPEFTAWLAARKSKGAQPPAAPAAPSLKNGTVIRSNVYQSEGDMTIIGPGAREGTYEAVTSGGRSLNIDPKHITEVVKTPAPAAPSPEPVTPAAAKPVEQAIADAVSELNWRGTVREVPAPRSMGGEGVKLYIPVDASGKDVSVGGQTILGKTPAEAIELAQKNTKPAPAAQAPAPGVKGVEEAVFTREEIDVSKPSISRRKRPNGTDGESVTEISAPSSVTNPDNWNRLGDTNKLSATVEARLDFASGKTPKKTDQAWTAYGGRRTERNRPILARGVTYEQAIEAAKDHVESANTKPTPAPSPAAAPAAEPSPATPQSEGGIFGYSWADIRSKQQGGTLAALIRGNAPKATESDFAVLEKHGMDWLYDNKKVGIIDRLGLPAERPSKKAVEVKPAATPKIIDVTETPGAQVSGPRLAIKLDDGTIIHSADAGIHAVLAARAGIDPSRIVDTGFYGMLSGEFKGGKTTTAPTKSTLTPVTEAAALRAKIVKGATVEVSLVRGSKLTHRATVQDVDTQNGVVTVTFKKGKKFNGGETQTVRLDQVAPLKSVRTRMLNKLQFEGMTPEQQKQTEADAKEFDKLVRNHPEMGWYEWRVDDLAGTKSGDMDIAAERKRASIEAMEALGGDPTWIHKDNSVMKAELLPKLKAAIEEKAHELAREAPDSALSDDTDLLPQGESPEPAPTALVAAKPETPTINVLKYNDSTKITGTADGGLYATVRTIKRKSGQMAYEVKGYGKAEGQHPDLEQTYEARGEQEAIDAAKEIARREIAKQTPEPAAPKLRPSDGKGTGELLQGEAAPFNLVAETAADIAKREAREAAEQVAKEAKDAAEAKAKQDKEQGNLFDEDPFTIADAAPVTSLPVASVQRAVRVVAERLAGAMPHEVIADGSQYPDRVKESAKERGITDLNLIRGVVVNGKIWINAAAIENPRQAIETFMHEAAGHGGTDMLLKAFGEKATTQLDAMLKRLFPDDYAAVQRRYEPHEQVSETLARIMQRVGPEMSAQHRTRWQRVVDWLRNALNKLGVKQWSTNDVMALLRRGVDAVRKQRAVTPDAGAVRMSYAGEKAQVPQFMRDSLDTAKAMAAAGKTSEEIRAVTGWFPGKYDGKMRWEVPDEGAAMLPLERKGRLARASEIARQLGTYSDIASSALPPDIRKAILDKVDAEPEIFPLSSVLKHDALFKAYPDAKDISVTFAASPSFKGMFIQKENLISLDEVRSDGKQNHLSTLLHEVQHWIQEKEKFASGSSPSKFSKDNVNMMVASESLAKDYRDAIALSNRVGGFTNEKVTSLPENEQTVALRAWNSVDESWMSTDQIKSEIAILEKRVESLAADFDGSQSYRRTAGEIESRDVQARQNFTPEQRKAVEPYSSENIAKEDAIVMRGGGPKMSIGGRVNPDTSDIRFSLKDENPEATSTKRAFTDAARAAREVEPTGVITKPSIEALKEGALAELARNKDAGRELVREIIGTAGQPDITPEKEALLAMHRRTLQNEIEMQSDRAMDESLTPEQREIANERWDDLEQEITELEDATNRTGSAWSNWGRIRMQETLRDFSFAMLTKRARKAKGGEQLTRDERAELKAQADAIIALHEKELARRTELANIERDEAAAAAFQQGKAEAEREAEENQPDPLVTAHSRQFIASLRAKAAPAVRRVKGIFDKGIGSKAGGESDVKMSLAPDPEKPAWFNDVALAGSAQMAEKNLSKEKWLASLKVLTGDTEGNLDPYADELWTASRTILEAEISADTGESKRVKTAKMKRNASKEQLIEGMAERVAEDGDTSNLGRYLKKLAVKLIESGVDTRETLVDAMHDAVKDIDPSLTREAVMDLWSDYGKFRPATTDEVKVKAAQLRGEVQQVRKLMDMEKGLAAKLTGIGRVEPSAEHRKLTKQVEDAKRRGGFTVTDPARQLRTAMDAIQTRLKNEIADMDYAIATRKPLAEHKNAIVYDAVTKGLKAQRDAKKAEYEKLFPKDTAAADLAAIARALDRSIAELSEQIKAGQLYPGKQGKKLTSPEIEAKRARIEALRDERTVLRGLDTARVEAAKTAAAQARIDELNRQRAAGWPDSPAGTPTVDTPELAALKARRDALLKERQTAQRPPTDPEMRRIEALDKLIAEKQAKIAAGDTSSKPKSQNVKTAEVTAKEAELRRLTVELAKLRNSDIARQLEQLKSRKSRQLADMLEKIAKKDFEPKAKPPEKPTDPELQSLDFQVSQAKGAIMEGMADLARSRRTGLEKTKDTTADVFHTARALMTGGEFSGVFRQGKLAALSHPVITFGQAVPAMFKAFRSAEGEHAEMNKIWARPNAAAYKRSGLALHNPWDFTAAQLEGNYRSRWANKIPFIAGSGRAYTLFLNNLRAGLYDTMSASLSSTEGALTAAQEKEISNFINKMTGSGNLGVRGQKASEYLNIFFFAPKFVASRFQMITGAVKAAGDVATGFQFAKENNAVRKLIAKEYGRMLTGIAVMYALYAAFRGDDEPIETDPRSSKFGKIPMGNGTYVDPLAGLSQVTVFLNTLLTGEVKNKKGNIKSVWADDDGSNVFGQGDGAFFTRFVRSKMSPVAGLFYDRFVTHKFVDGKPFAYKDAVLNLATPMTYGDIYEAMRAQGVPKGTVLSILAMFGEGVNTYESDSKPTHARRYSR